MKGKRITEFLPVEFTQDELDEKREQLSSTVLKYDDVEDEKKRIAKGYTEQLQGLRGDMRRLSKDIRRKNENRTVDCVARFHDPTPGMKTIVRLDTGEVVRTEGMSHDERQENMFDDVEDIERMYRAEDARPEDAPPPAPTDGEQPSV
jgi:hypothetical protein